MAMNFSNWLSKKLADEDMSQADLVRKSGLSRQAIYYYLSGKSKQPDEFALQKIAKAFNVPVEQIYREVGILPADKTIDPEIEEIMHLAIDLDKEDRKAVIDFISILDRLRSKKK